MSLWSLFTVYAMSSGSATTNPTRRSEHNNGSSNTRTHTSVVKKMRGCRTAYINKEHTKERTKKKQQQHTFHYVRAYETCALTFACEWIIIIRLLANWIYLLFKFFLYSRRARKMYIKYSRIQDNSWRRPFKGDRPYILALKCFE